MEEFVDLFTDMVVLGIMGIYKILSTERDKRDIMFRNEPAIRKANASGAILNMKFNLIDERGHILPQTPWELINMFELPMSEIIDKLPEECAKTIKEHTYFYGLDPLVECMDSEECSLVLTDDGIEMLSNRIIYNSINNANLIDEYLSQKIFEEMCKADYVKVRLFLENRDNVAIPVGKPLQSEEQRDFIRSYPKLLKLCYSERKENILFRCKHCGMVLQEYRLGKYRCITKKCNEYLFEKEPISIAGKVLVMNEIVARSIYYPGILEGKIRNMLDKYKIKGKVVSYDLFPGERDGIYDTWDFRVYMKNGKTYLIDAKDHQNVHWIINDKIHRENNSELLYVVPNTKSKAYLNSINDNFKNEKNVRCVKLKELEKLLGEEGDK